MHFFLSSLIFVFDNTLSLMRVQNAFNRILFSIKVSYLDLGVTLKKIFQFERMIISFDDIF